MFHQSYRLIQIAITQVTQPTIPLYHKNKGFEIDMATARLAKYVLWPSGRFFLGLILMLLVLQKLVLLKVQKSQTTTWNVKNPVNGISTTNLPQLVSENLLDFWFSRRNETKQHQFWSRGAFPPASFTVTQPSRGPIPCCKRYPERRGAGHDAGFKSFGFFFWRKAFATWNFYVSPRKNLTEAKGTWKIFPKKDIWRKISSLVVFSVTLQGRFLQSKLLDLT